MYLIIAQKQLINQYIYIKILKKMFFIKKPKQTNIIKNLKTFVNMILDLKLYLIKFSLKKNEK